jgi:hypothetical protein
MRTAFTLREWKEHKQKHLLKKFLNSGGFAARSTSTTAAAAASTTSKAQLLARHKHFESTALYLQQKEENEYVNRIKKKEINET